MAEVLQTIAPDQITAITDVSEDTFVVVSRPGAPLQRVPYDQLLSKLIKTDLVFATVADLTASLGHDEDVVALVRSDPTPALNGWYRKIGGSGTGSWEQFETLSKATREAAETAAGEAQDAAVRAQGVVNYFGTIAEAVAALEPGEVFTTPEITAENPNGEDRRYIRKTAAPGYELTADQPISKNALGAPGGAAKIGTRLPGLGARFRTQADRNEDAFSLADYAFGDGRVELGSIQECFKDAIAAGKDVYVPNGYFNGNGGRVVLTGPVGFYGPGRLNVMLQVGSPGAQVQWNKRFLGTMSGPSAGIDLQNARNLDINTMFLGCDVAIHGTATAASAFHSISQIDISGSRFIGCTRDIYLQRDAGVTTLVYSDWTEGGVYASGVKYEHFYWDQMDGILVNKVTVLMPRGAVTRSAYRGKETEWAHFVAPVNLFECGEEAIYMEEIGVIKAADLGIAFCGQQVPASGIRIKNTTKFLNANITDNHIEKPTKHKVEIESAGAGWSGDIDGNTGAIDERVGSGENRTYFGSTSLDSIPHYNVSTPAGSNRAFVGVNPGVYINIGGTSSSQTSNVQGTLGHDITPLRYAGEGSAYRAFAVTGASISIFRFEDSFGLQNSIDGEVYLIVKSADSNAAGVKSAQYRFLVHCGPDGNAIGTVEKLGATTGGASDEPSFTWSISATKTLQASAVSQTNGTFHFFARYRGNVRLRS